jgi:hypothetical protein
MPVRPGNISGYEGRKIAFNLKILALKLKDKKDILQLKKEILIYTHY